jgi:hypothetical protein
MKLDATCTLIRICLYQYDRTTTVVSSTVLHKSTKVTTVGRRQNHRYSISFLETSSVLRQCYLRNNLSSFSAFPKEDPMIEGVLSSYSIGDYVTANCTSGKSNPLAVMSWEINDVKVCIVDLRAIVCQPLLSSCCHNGLFWDRLITGLVQCLKICLQHLAVKTEVIWIIYDQRAEKHAWNYNKLKHKARRRIE